MDKLKIFVWEKVLTDWSDGIVFVVAKDLEKAIKLIKEKNSTAASSMDMSVVREVKKPEAFVMWGGG